MFKEWVTESKEEIFFDNYNEVLINMCANFYHYYWHNRHNFMHEVEDQKIIMLNEIENNKRQIE